MKEADAYFKQKNQIYLQILFGAMLLAGYYGLLHAGEITKSPHCLRAKKVQIGVNKKKLLFVLETSKTHNVGDDPQIIKIKATPTASKGQAIELNSFCPFGRIDSFLKVRPKSKTSDEQFFVFSDNSPVKPEHFRNYLRIFLEKIIFSQNYTICMD